MRTHLNGTVNLLENIRKYLIYKDTDTKGRWSPPFETAWQESDSYAFSYCQWEPIRNSQLIRKYKEIPVYIRITDTKGKTIPPIETGRALSELYAFQCCQWEPIRNSQLKRKYKEIPVYIRIQIPKADGPPLVETARALSDLYTLQCSQWAPIWNSQTRKYQHIEKICRHQRQMDPPSWNCQSSEWTLHFSMQWMRSHLKQSSNRKIVKEMSPGESYIYIYCHLVVKDGNFICLLTFCGQEWQIAHV